MIKSWFQIFINHSVKNKTFTLLTIVGLAIGITGVIFSTLYWQSEKSYDQWNSEKEHVYEVLSVLPNGDTWGYSQSPLAKNIKVKTSKLKDYCYYLPIYLNDNIVVNSKNFYVNQVLVAQTNFFDFFPFEFTKGSKEAFKNNKNAIALEEKEAVLLFGKQNPINQTVIMNGEKLRVMGVYVLQKPSSVEPKYVISIDMNGFSEDNNAWGDYNYCLLLKLNQPTDVTEIEQVAENVLTTNKLIPAAKDQGVSLEQFTKENGKFTVKLQSLSNARLSKNVTGFLEGKGNRLFLQINVGLSVLILALSIINYINLSTAQAMRRAKEVGVKKVFGASKKNIIAQFVFETSLITLFALFFALCITELCLPYYNALIDKALQIHLAHYWHYLIFIFIVVVICAGFFPALYIANFKEINVLKGSFARSKNGIWLRNGMLILQFSIATFFIVSGFIVTKQVNHLANKDLGFNAEQIISVKYGGYSNNKFNTYASFKNDLLKIKGVTNVNISTANIGSGSGSTSSFSLPNSTFSTQAHNIAFDFGYLNMFKIELKEGRDLTNAIASDTIENVLINQQVVKDLGGNVPLGTSFTWNGQKMKVVGIVNNFNLTSPQEEIPPMLFMHVKTVNWMASNINNVLIKINPEHTKETLAAIETFWKKKVDANTPFEYDFVDKKFARSYETYTKQQKMFRILNIVVLTIALFGLFALASFTIERRFKEIAIRKVLGAQTSTLIKLLTKQYIYMAIAGFFIALFPSYLLMQQWLNNFNYRITIDPFTYVFSFLILVCLTLLVVLLKAYTATQINLLRFIKYE